MTGAPRFGRLTTLPTLDLFYRLDSGRIMRVGSVKEGEIAVVGQAGIRQFYPPPKIGDDEDVTCSVVITKSASLH